MFSPHNPILPKLCQKVFFIAKILNKRELHQIASNHSPGIDFKEFVNLYSFIVIDATLVSDDHSFSERIF